MDVNLQMSEGGGRRRRRRNYLRPPGPGCGRGCCRRRQAGNRCRRGGGRSRSRGRNESLRRYRSECRCGSRGRTRNRHRNESLCWSRSERWRWRRRGRGVITCRHRTGQEHQGQGAGQCRFPQLAGSSFSHRRNYLNHPWTSVPARSRCSSGRRSRNSGSDGLCATAGPRRLARPERRTRGRQSTLALRPGKEIQRSAA